MTPLESIDASTSPDGSPLTLHRHGNDWYIRSAGRELMSSRQSSSERAMAEHIPASAEKVLIGGLGMGFTLRAALDASAAIVTVAELIPAVVEWNRVHLGHLTGKPLDDARARLHVGDVGELLRTTSRWDAILLDVDNGPDAFTQVGNGWLYGLEGLKRTRMALRAGGVLVYWSAYPSAEFVERTRRAGLRTETHTVRAHAGKGPRHTLFVCKV